MFYCSMRASLLYKTHDDEVKLSRYVKTSNYKLRSTKYIKYNQQTTTRRAGNMLTQDALLRVLTPLEPLAVIRCYNFKSTTLLSKLQIYSPFSDSNMLRVICYA